MLSSAPLWLIGAPLGGALAVYVVARARAWAARWTALAALGLAWAAWLARLNADPNFVAVLTIGGQSLQVDGLSILVDVLALSLGTVAVVFSGPDLHNHRQEAGYYALLLLQTGAVLGLASATDLFNLWLWFETMAVSSYVLVAFYRTESASLEGAVKYLVQSATGSILVVLGIALVLAQTGTLQLAGVRGVAGPSPMLLAAGGLLLVGFGTKAGLVPLHTWVGDAYSEAPSGVGMVFSGVVTKLGLVAALRAIAALAGVGADWAAILMGSGVLAIAVGNGLALRQRELKRMLAWSSLAHLGYALLGVGIGVYALRPSGAQGGVFQLLTHAIMTGAAFMAAGALLYALHSTSRHSASLTITDLAGAARRYPLVAFALSLALLGLGGLPPLAGFMSEWEIFVSGFDTREPLIIALTLFAAMNVAVSLAYYVPVVLMLYRRRTSPLVWQAASLPSSMTLPVIALTCASLVLGVWPTLASGVVEPAAAVIVRSFGGA